MKQRMQGNFDTLSKNLFQLLQHGRPLSTLDTPVPCFLRTQRPSPAMVLSKRFLGYSGNEAGGRYVTGSAFQHPHLWGQHKTSTIQTEQPDLLESSQGPKKVQQRGADLSKKSLLETHAATQRTIWSRDATCDVEIACTLQHFVERCMGHELEASDLIKTTSTSWDTGLGATSPTHDQL